MDENPAIKVTQLRAWCIRVWGSGPSTATLSRMRLERGLTDSKSPKKERIAVLEKFYAPHKSRGVIMSEMRKAGHRVDGSKFHKLVKEYEADLHHRKSFQPLFRGIRLSSPNPRKEGSTQEQRALQAYADMFLEEFPEITEVHIKRVPGQKPSIRYKRQVVKEVIDSQEYEL
jgi:hypothetical protein